MRNSLFIIAIGFACVFANAHAQSTIPRLVKSGSTTQLLVDNKPFLILGGELGNSSASSNEYMRAIWPKLKLMNLNAVTVMTFAPKENNKKAGFLSVDEGRFESRIWKPGRRMNGDQDHQGRHVRIPGNEYSIQHVKLYAY